MVYEQNDHEYVIGTVIHFFCDEDILKYMHGRALWMEKAARLCDKMSYYSYLVLVL